MAAVMPGGAVAVLILEILKLIEISLTSFSRAQVFWSRTIVLACMTSFVQLDMACQYFSPEQPIA